ncbi:UDP-N-acetylmuramoyl-L-alanine--D-glutamate ligase [Parasphingopyxis lamellibrachiae]|uniref:UDP-N-acetylmuramoylalanine--D-glutamate ligase n=1 Tax=Parasphingopyxis lamellibrachiae TaxID=680125 RepID=A0A3D9FH53_9SPHN|nr:UDP-N-acetylmuramoyl-L-alanine--D-glutamate ligase [Parasphingopyxis lamellibrachiae]RED16416.1 UDP-N-acetylmuramoylalanine--D-glutamate ligase [Parasphingopyxis lamellibrachiae]
MKPARAFAGKRYAVLGLARTGLSVVDYLWNSSASLVAWDDREEAREQVQGKARLADPLGMDLGKFDGIVVSPGVPINRHPIAQKAREAGVPLIGDIELFAQARAELPPHRVVGITGTNGKSTTTALIHHIVKTAGIPVRLGGNIGKPILGEQELEEGGVYVLELSSFQIDLTQSLDCDVAILLNVTPDHLDRYENFEAYAASKARLFEMQSAGHAKIIAIDDAPSQAIAAGAEGAVMQISAGGCMDQSNWPALQGPHNAQNAIAAMSAARRLGIGEEAIEAALRTFPGLPHRMERVGDRGGVLFINDSKATNPTSTAPALAAYPAIHWIVGGRAKADDLDACEPYFGHVRAAYTVGETAATFEKLLTPWMPVSNCGTIRQAVQIAAQAARPGETVLLSPACASFDQYRDFEERGDDFRAAVGGLS